VNYEVRVKRRDVSKTLVQSLEGELTSARLASQASGKPMVILLDQIEEVFTDPKFDGTVELAALGRHIKNILHSAEQRPKIICSPSALMRQTEGLHEGRISGSS
jgi:hypothetical protein